MTISERTRRKLKHGPGSTWRVHVWALGFYAALALLLTWPLARHLTTHVAGDGIDDPSLAWNLWWIKARLVDQHAAAIFHADWMFHPIDINLAFYTLTPLNGFLSIPLQVAGGLIVATNLLLLLSFVLGGYGTFLLSWWLLAQTMSDGRRHVDREILVLAALGAGVIYAFASSKLFYAGLGQFNIASNHWIPFYVLALLQVGRVTDVRRGYRVALLAGLWLVLQAWSELTYASFLLIFTALYFVWQMATALVAHRAPETPRPGLLLLRFVVVGLVFMAGIAPFLWAMAPDLMREGDFFASGGGFADIFSADLMGYLVPTRLHPLLGDWVATLPFPNDKGQHLYIGYGAFTLVVIGLVGLLRARHRAARRAGWLWLMMLLVFWSLTLGPSLRWAGRDLGIPGPFALVSRLPFFSGNRYPSRYSVMLMLVVALLAAFGLLFVLVRRRDGRPTGARFLAALGLIFVAEHLSVPLPLNDFRTPSLYAQLATMPGDVTLLELPTGWRNGARVLGKSDVLIMMQQWYQTTHGLRRLGGNTSRNPDYKFQYFTDAPLLGTLIALMNADRDHIDPEVERQWTQLVAEGRVHGAEVLDFLNVGAVTVHVEQAPEPLLRYIDEALPLQLAESWRGVDWRGKPSEIRLYTRTDVSFSAPSSQVIDLAGPSAALYLAEGWAFRPDDGVRYALRDRVELLLNVPEEGADLVVELIGPAQVVDIWINGHLLAGVELMPHQVTPVSLTVPPGLADQPVDRLGLRFHGDGAPAATLRAPSRDSGWPIGSTGVDLRGDVALVVRSAGEEVGDFARILVNGVEQAANERGYNLVALSTDGVVRASVVFDTLMPGVGAAMAAWIEQWPSGTVIAGAVADEASLNLTDDAVAALATVGVATDLRGHFRWSHAFVGVKGAPAGSALEALELLKPAAVTVGSPVDGPTVTGGVRRITIGP